MNNFVLKNYCSINLNFIVYINNLYKNFINKSLNKFPIVEISKEHLLESQCISLQLQKYWNNILLEKNILDSDIDFWLEEKFNYRNLFNLTEDNYIIYEKIKELFESWFWGTGYLLLNKFSEQYVEDYYKKFIELIKKTGYKFSSDLIGIQVIYDNVPSDWETITKDLFIICPNDKLPNAKKIFQSLTQFSL